MSESIQEWSWSRSIVEISLIGWSCIGGSWAGMCYWDESWIDVKVSSCDLLESGRVALIGVLDISLIGVMHILQYKSKCLSGNYVTISIGLTVT